MMKKICMLLVVIVAISCNTAFSKDLMEIRLNMAHTPWYLFGTYLIGIERGYFAEEGIKLKLVSSGGSSEAIQMVALNKDHFSETGSTPAIIGKSKRMPISVVASIANSGYSGGVFYWKKSGIISPKDLKGKKIASNSKSVNWPAISSLLKEQAVEATLVSVPVNMELLFFLDGKVDAYVGMLYAEKNKLESVGAKGWGYFLFRDYGIEFPGPVITTNEEFAKKNPRITKGFLRAAMKSWQYSRENPEQAVRALVEAYPELKYEIELNRLKLTHKFIDFSLIKPGHSDQKVWDKSIEILLKAGFVSRRFKSTELLNDDFLP